MVANLFSDSWRGTIGDIALLVGVITASLALFGKLVKGPAQRWLVTTIRPLLDPMEVQVKMLTSSIEEVVRGSHERWLQHDAHHDLMEYRFSERLDHLSDRIKRLEAP